MPKPSAEAKSAFQALVPEDPGVLTRPMFGNLAAFVGGNMFAGLFGEDLFVRLPAEQRDQVLAQGGADFEPMPGRPMSGYVLLPGGWKNAKAARTWITRSLAWAADLPPKPPKARKNRRTATRERMPDVVAALRASRARGR